MACKITKLLFKILPQICQRSGLNTLGVRKFWACSAGKGSDLIHPIRQICPERQVSGTSKNTRDEVFRMVKKDAEAAMALRKQQAEMSTQLVRLLSRVCDTFETMSRTHQLRTSLYEAYTDESSAAPIAAPSNAAAAPAADPAPAAEDEPKVDEEAL